MAPSGAQHRNLSPGDVHATTLSPPPATREGKMPPPSRMNLASLLQPESDTQRRPPPAPAPAPTSTPQPLGPPAPPAPYSNDPPSSYSSSHPPHPPSYPPGNSSQSYTGSQYSHAYPSQPSHGSHSYHPGSYTPSPTHTSQAPAHHSHPFHSHSHPLHPHSVPQGHSHLSSHPHPQHPHHAHHQHSHSHHSHAHSHHPLSHSHPHSHVHVIHSHPPGPASNAPSGAQPLPAPPGPGSSSSVAGSPPYAPSHAFGSGPPPSSSRGPQPIIPITPAPRSPVAAYTGASRSPTAPYSIYGAGAIISGGRRSPEFSSSGPSSGSRRNTLSGPGGPQPIDPVPLRDYPPYPGGGSKHPDDYPPPAFTAPTYSRPESPQTATGGKGRRSGGGATSTSSRNARADSVKRSIGGAGEIKRTTDRSRERDRNEREMDKEHEERMYREKIAMEREREERAREREYEERVMRERERERERERQHELEMRDARDSRLPALQQSRPSHHYVHHPTPPPASSLPILAPIWLGTHVYPNLPFPICLPPSLSRNNLTPDGYRPYQYTILVPSGFLPLQPAARVPRPTIPLWGSAITGYTDDSNLLLAAVHSGRTNWSDIRRAKRLKHDAKIIVGIWVGGANGGRNAQRPKGGAWEGGQGSGQLYSSSWGNSHDGGGMEIVEVLWTEKDSAHAPHRPNRRERMEQYAKRRADLDLVPPVKRDRVDTWYLDSDDEDAQLSAPAKRTWDVGETIVFGKGGTTSGFVYDPHALRSVVFEESNERSTKRLKSRPKPGDEDLVSRRDIVLENDDEQYILSLDGKARTYTLSTLSPKSKKAEVLRKSVTEEDVSFFDKGLCVWIKDDEANKGDNEKADKDSEMAYDETMSNDRKGWFCRVNRWKFAPDADTPTATVSAS
ncbi:hypothetical protein FRC11_007000 [Ceratobasidium sp. 423]|nr:hypothetical protein FRC11_007000 [Ceratobasidium sp. 423]